jgi:hypothetical protein
MDREGKRSDLLYDFRGNDLARTAPGCKGIENDDLVVLKSGLELCFAVQHVRISPSTIEQLHHHCGLNAFALAHLGKENIPRKIVDTHIDSRLLESFGEVVVDERRCGLSCCSE